MPINDIVADPCARIAAHGFLSLGVAGSMYFLRPKSLAGRAAQYLSAAIAPVALTMLIEVPLLHKHHVAKPETYVALCMAEWYIPAIGVLALRKEQDL